MNIFSPWKLSEKSTHLPVFLTFLLQKQTFFSLQAKLILNSPLESICLTVCLSVHPSICLTIYPSIHLSLSIYIYLPIFFLLGCGPYAKLILWVSLYGSFHKNTYLRTCQVRFSERAIGLFMHPSSLSTYDIFIHCPCTNHGKNRYVWIKLWILLYQLLNLENLLQGCFIMVWH